MIHTVLLSCNIPFGKPNMDIEHEHQWTIVLIGTVTSSINGWVSNMFNIQCLFAGGYIKLLRCFSILSGSWSYQGYHGTSWERGEATYTIYTVQYIYILYMYMIPRFIFANCVAFWCICEWVWFLGFADDCRECRTNHMLFRVHVASGELKVVSLLWIKFRVCSNQKAILQMVFEHCSDTLLYIYLWNKSHGHNTVAKCSPFFRPLPSSRYQPSSKDWPFQDDFLKLHSGLEAAKSMSYTFSTSEIIARGKHNYAGNWLSQIATVPRQVLSRLSGQHDGVRRLWHLIAKKNTKCNWKVKDTHTLNKIWTYLYWNTGCSHHSEEFAKKIVALRKQVPEDIQQAWLSEIDLTWGLQHSCMLVGSAWFSHLLTFLDISSNPYAYLSVYTDCNSP